MRYLVTLLASILLALGASVSVLASNQTQKEAARSLTNADVLDMLNAGVSQEVVVAKIKKSACEFDTSPSALKALKASSASDVVVLAMIEASSGSPNTTGTSVTSNSQDTPKAEAALAAHVDCHHTDPVPVYSAPLGQQISGQPITVVAEVFQVKCGDAIGLLDAPNGQRWLKIRASDGQVGYISVIIVSIDPISDSQKQRADKERAESLKAADEMDGCKVRAQNEFDTKTNLVNTLALTPIQRVAASSKLKQNYDGEVRWCRSEYEVRQRAIETEK
jgi:hypothetical protein